MLDGQDSAAPMNVDTWNTTQVQERSGRHVAELAGDLEAGMAGTLALLAQVSEDQLGRRCGALPNVPAALEARVRHEQAHASDIINGLQMLR